MALTYTIAAAGLATVVAAAAGDGISGVSWGAQRMDIFGADSNNNIFHKYYTAFGWGPDDPAHGDLERYTDSNASAPVSAASWESNRLDFMFVDTNGWAQHKYWDGSSWQPNGMDGYEAIGGGVHGKLALNSWGPGRLDVVGRSGLDSYYHKAWTGTEYYPPKDLWEDLGGTFISAPATVSWGSDRLDIFGVTVEGKIAHKYWDGYQWNPAGKDWENLGGENFAGTPFASSMAKNRFDIFAVSNDTGVLWHKYWDGWTMSNWGELGGNFTSAPSVIHWGPNRIDILGLDASDASYQYKFYDGYQWNGWYNKGGPFHSEPTLVSVGENNLNMFGVDDNGDLKLQVWDGAQWLPSADGWYALGNTIVPKGDAETVIDTETETVVGNKGVHEDEKVLVQDGVRVELRFRA